MKIQTLLMATAVAMSAAPALAAGPNSGLGSLYQPDARGGYDATPHPSPFGGFGQTAAPYGGSFGAPAAAPTPSRPAFAPLAPVGRIRQPAPLEPFKPFKGGSTYNRPSATPGYPTAPKPPGYISTY